MQISNMSKNTLKKLQLMTGQSLSDTKRFLKYFFSILILDFLENQSTHIPYFGEIKINYIKDIIRKEGKEAEINIDFIADKQLLKSIGQIIDNEESDLEKFLFKEIQENLTESVKK